MNVKCNQVYMVTEPTYAYMDFFSLFSCEERTPKLFWIDNLYICTDLDSHIFTKYGDVFIFLFFVCLFYFVWWIERAVELNRK